MHFLLNYIFFFLKTFTLVAAILFTFAGFIILSKTKNKLTHRIRVRHINHRYNEITERIQSEILSKSQLKVEEKKRKQLAAQLKDKSRKRVYFVKFIGDMHASEAESLREKITAILAVANGNDEVVID
ncbi:MAG: protease SohB, partial [Gammaproteobacteria bacterium]